MSDEYQTASDELIDSDKEELTELEQMLYGLPDGAMVPGRDSRAAAEYRLRLSAALLALTALLSEVKDQTPGVTRARLLAPLARWRTDRARAKQILRRPLTAGD